MSTPYRHSCSNGDLRPLTNGKPGAHARLVLSRDGYTIEQCRVCREWYVRCGIAGPLVAFAADRPLVDWPAAGEVAA